MVTQHLDGDSSPTLPAHGTTPLRRAVPASTSSTHASSSRCTFLVMMRIEDVCLSVSQEHYFIEACSASQYEQHMRDTQQMQFLNCFHDGDLGLLTYRALHH